MGSSTLGIVDACPHQAGRETHLQARIAAAMLAKGPELFAQPPAIEAIDDRRAYIEATWINIMSTTTAFIETTASEQTETEQLFQPFRMGRYNLPHRVVMAPLTRSRTRQTRERALGDERLLLRAESFGRVHHYGSDSGVSAGTRICMDARHTHTRSGRGLAACHGGSA
jgi:hypothetical protein